MPKPNWKGDLATNRAGAFTPFGPNAKHTKVSVTGTSAQHSFQRSATLALLANVGSEDIFLAFAADNDPTATADNFPIRQGETLELPIVRGTSEAVKMAAICTSSGDLRIMENGTDPA